MTIFFSRQAPPLTIQIRQAVTESDLRAVYDLRSVVFREEQRLADLPMTDPDEQLDVLHLGRPNVICCHRIGDVLVDPGPQSCEEHLLTALGDRVPQAILLTHIHPDHAGATGALVRRWPHLVVAGHERGRESAALDIAPQGIGHHCTGATDNAGRDVGRTERTATKAQRNAIVIRDRHCIIPHCDAPPRWCEIHHVVWFRNGGCTTISNLALVCGRHHRQIHAGKIRMTLIEGEAQQFRFENEHGEELRKPDLEADRHTQAA